MGYGINISCNCKSMNLLLGVGMNYPMVYKEITDKLKSGEYGEEMKHLFGSRPIVTIDAATAAYGCRKCGHIEEAPVLDLYVPKDIEKAKKVVITRWTAGEQSIDKTVEELGGFPYWAPDLFRDGGEFEILKKYEHICPECGERMVELNNEDDLRDMTCPDCGEHYWMGGGMLWD